MISDAAYTYVSRKSAIKINPNNDAQNGLRFRLKDFGSTQLAVPAADLDQELFISFATPSEYVRRAELADSRIGERTGERVNISAVTDTVEMECEDLPLPLAYAGDKKVKRFHFSEIIGRLPYVRATVTCSMSFNPVAKTSS